MKIDLSTEPADNSFVTYTNYLTHLNRLMSADSKVATVTETMTSRAYGRIARTTDVDKERVTRLLANAWFTEQAVEHNASHAGTVPANVTWIPIQLYYSSYLSARALFVATGDASAGNSHEATLSSLSNMVRQRAELFPPALGTTCRGGPKTGHAYDRVPATVDPDDFHPLAKNGDVWASLCALLRRTRADAIDARKVDWRRTAKRTRVGRTEQEKIERSLRPTTLFDALYRLRIRSNYTKVDDVLASLGHTTLLASYSQAATSILDRLLLGIEVLIERYVGPEPYSEILESFDAKLGTRGSARASERRGYLASARKALGRS